MAIPIESLADVLAQELEDFNQDVTDGLKDSVKNAAKACVAELKSSSPELTGSYAQGWRARTAYDGPSDIRMQVHNKTDYQITHLLEDGHANVDGGRTPAYPHIGPAAEKASELLEKDVKIKVGLK